MSNILTDSRVAIMAQLEQQLTANGDAFTVVAGERDGVSRDRNIACVFLLPVVTNGDVNFANPTMIVRAWVRQPKSMKTTTPQDPGPVEQLAIDVASVLKGTQMPSGLNIYWILQQLELDYADWGVQATLLGWTVNPATVIQ